MFERPRIKITYVHVPKVCNLSYLASARVIMVVIRVYSAQKKMNRIYWNVRTSQDKKHVHVPKVWSLSRLSHNRPVSKFAISIIMIRQSDHRRGIRVVRLIGYIFIICFNFVGEGGIGFIIRTLHVRLVGAVRGALRGGSRDQRLGCVKVI